MSTKGYVTAGEVMTLSPKMVHGLTTVQEAIEIMREHAISSVVVDRRYEGDEYGLLVVTDIATKLIAKDRSPERTNVYEIMTKPVISVTGTWISSTRAACSPTSKSRARWSPVVAISSASSPCATWCCATLPPRRRAPEPDVPARVAGSSQTVQRAKRFHHQSCNTAGRLSGERAARGVLSHSYAARL